MNFKLLVSCCFAAYFLDKWVPSGILFKIREDLPYMTWRSVDFYFCDNLLSIEIRSSLDPL
jgi:hypothetical protein